MPVSRTETQEAFRRLKPRIDASYPKGWFVALDGEQIIADAANFDDLTARLIKMGRKPPETFMVQAGVDYPEYAVILDLSVFPCV
jgi:hypothetical protein